MFKIKPLGLFFLFWGLPLSCFGAQSQTDDPGIGGGGLGSASGVFEYNTKGESNQFPQRDSVVPTEKSEEKPVVKSEEKNITVSPTQTKTTVQTASARPVKLSPAPAPVREQIAKAVEDGDNATAMKLAEQALKKYPQDREIRNFVDQGKQGKVAKFTESSVKERAKQLLEGMRDNSSLSLASEDPVMASPISQLTAGRNSAAFSPQAMSAMTIGHDGSLRFSDIALRDAANKISLRDFLGAEDLLSHRLKTNPKDSLAYRMRSWARRNLGKISDSKKDALAAIKLNPGDSRAHRIFIDDEVDLGHSDQALAHANKLLALNPRDAQILAARADVWASLGNREQQLADLKMAATIDGQFDSLYQHTVTNNSPFVSTTPRKGVSWLGAIGLGLLLFSLILFKRRGDSTMRTAMRTADHVSLQNIAEPILAPTGFKILKTLGQGGMGIVYEAMDLGLRRIVAIKRLRNEVADHPRERVRFLKEARTVAALKHPNIVEIYSIHENSDGLFLVFEKVLGETLHEKAGRGLLPAKEVVEYLRQMALALDHAHAAGVVHQDLKPGNVMVSGGIAKVMDFGIARRVAETMSTMSKVEVVGTPSYMAPEQERGTENVGPASDLFSLGVCAYELLAGRTPFPNGGLMMKVEKLFRPASQLNPKLPAAVNDVIARALDPEPAKRWPSGKAFIEALSRAIA